MSQTFIELLYESFEFFLGLVQGLDCFFFVRTFGSLEDLFAVEFDFVVLPYHEGLRVAVDVLHKDFDE